MGMYTELKLDVVLVLDTPDKVINVLKLMLKDLLSEAAPDIELPDHPLFRTVGWRYMLVMSSCYFETGESKLKTWKDTTGRQRHNLHIHCSFKNYNDEIKHFLDWINDYVEISKYTDSVGHFRYEESKEATKIYIKERTKEGTISNDFKDRMLNLQTD